MCKFPFDDTDEEMVGFHQLGCFTFWKYLASQKRLTLPILPKLVIYIITYNEKLKEVTH